MVRAGVACFSVTPVDDAYVFAPQMSGTKSFSAFPDGDNLFEWLATIEGSPGTVYEGLTYKLNMKFPADYPFSAPTITFTTACFHPNVDQFGNICLDILKVSRVRAGLHSRSVPLSLFPLHAQDKWSAAYSVSTILVSIQSLLGGTELQGVLLCALAAGCEPRPSRAQQRESAERICRPAVGQTRR